MTDLHSHTTYSDSSLSVSKTIRRAAEGGVTHLAITDHDTLAGLTEALDAGKRYGIAIIPGIEISAYDFARKKKVHILGLGIDPESETLASFCKPVLERRRELSLSQINTIRAEGFDIDYCDARRHESLVGVIYKQHIMHALVDKIYCDKIYCSLYKMLFAPSWKGTAGLAYSEIEYLDAFAAIREVKAAGGIPVLAHPGQKDNFDSIPDLVEAGISGIEAFHPCHSREITGRSLAAAGRYGLLVTGGTDYHGYYGEHEILPGIPGADMLQVLRKLEKTCLV